MKSIFSKLLLRKNTLHSGHAPDRVLLFLICILSLLGIVMVYDSSVAIAIRDFHNPYYYVFQQLQWFGLGTVVFLLCSRIPYDLWYKWSLPLLCVIFVLLIAVFIPGIGVHALGAHRWINFGFFVLQPAELAKFAMIIYLAAWFSTPEKGRFGAFLLLLGMVVGLVVLEPDLGTATIILLIALAMYFLSGASLHHFAILLPVLGAGVLLLAVISPYRMQRLLTFMNRERDPLGASYQIRQVLLALGSGGWTGVGIGRSRQKYEYLPEANTDAIFAIIGEESGFIGSAVVISLYGALLWRGYRIAMTTTNVFGKLLALGVTTWIGIQTSINLSAMVAILPLTGVPLPLISYGGSSVIVLLASLGILYNVSRFTKTTP